jgi:cytochrome c biogenesis protein CcmG/thiol:disulfide interchange protein DsbE
MAVTDTRPRWRRWLTFWNVVTVAVLVWAAPRLLPHLGAVVGLSSGGRIVPAYDVTTLDGRHLTTDSLRGRVVLVNFWATWCGPCRVEMPLLQRMYERHRSRGFVLLGLSVDRGSADAVRRYLREQGVSYPVAIVGAAEERAFGGVRGYPTSFLIDRSGVVQHAVIGPLAPATLELAVRRLLAEQAVGAPSTQAKPSLSDIRAP